MKDILRVGNNRVLAPKYLYKLPNFKEIFRNAKCAARRDGYPVILCQHDDTGEFSFCRLWNGNKQISELKSVWKETALLVVYECGAVREVLCEEDWNKLRKHWVTALWGRKISNKLKYE